MELGYLGMGLFGESPFGFELLGLLGWEIHGFNELGFGGKKSIFWGFETELRSPMWNKLLKERGSLKATFTVWKHWRTVCVVTIHWLHEWSVGSKCGFEENWENTNLISTPQCSRNGLNRIMFRELENRVYPLNFRWFYFKLVTSVDELLTTCFLSVFLEASAFLLLAATYFF